MILDTTREGARYPARYALAPVLTEQDYMQGYDATGTWLGESVESGCWADAQAATELLDTISNDVQIHTGKSLRDIREPAARAVLSRLIQQ